MESYKYIFPNFIQSNTIDGINEFKETSSKKRFIFEEKTNKDYRSINFNDLEEINRAIILGEPGCGKSRLIKQYIEFCEKKNFEKLEIILKERDFNKQFDDIKEFIERNEGKRIYIFLDALDEVDLPLFPFAVKFIAQLSQSYPHINIWFSCREYYVKGNIYQFNQLTGFQYVLIDRFDQNEILEFIQTNIRNQEIKDTIISALRSKETGQSLLSIFQIPRYLTEICVLIEGNEISSEEIRKWKRTDYFDKAIYSKLMHEENDGCVNGVDISKRILEKVALVMEIKRTNSITFDEFITILDEIKSNLSVTFLSFYSIDNFIKRVLKRTDDLIEFENTEFQEYLAAKEIIRMKSPEQVLYDFMVDTELNHIYESWYDVLGYIIELYPQILFYVADLIVQKRNQLSDDRIFKLIHYADLGALGETEKRKLFSVYYMYFMTHEVYLNQYTDILVQLYLPEMYNEYLIQPPTLDSSISYHYKIFNKTGIIAELINKRQLSQVQKCNWISHLKELTKNNENENAKKAALYALGELSEKNILLEIKEYVYGGKSESLERCYLRNLSKVHAEEDEAIYMFFDGISKKYKEGTYGITGLRNPQKVVDTYNILFSNAEYTASFFASKYEVLAYYHINEQLEEVYKSLPEQAKKLSFQFLDIILPNHYPNRNQKELCIGIVSFLKDKYEDLVSKLLSYFDDSFVLDDKIWLFTPIINIDDLARIKSYVNEMDKCDNGDYILQLILQQIRNSNNPEKEIIYEEGRKLYSERYDRWENPDPKKDKTNPAIKQITKISPKDNLNKCWKISELGRELSIDDLLSLDEKTAQKLEMAIASIIDTINLDEFWVRHTETGKNFNNLLIPYLDQYIRILCNLGKQEIVKERYRSLLIKTLPIYINIGSFSQENLGFLFEIIGEISSEEEIELFRWIDQRKDDYLYMSPNSLFGTIKHYRLSSFSPFVRKFIEPNCRDVYTAKEALHVLMENFMNTEEFVLEEIFSRTPSDEIKRVSLEELANYYLISKYSNEAAVQWRINYIKEHIYEFDLYDFIGSRSMSEEEVEMEQPTMCNCFYDNLQVSYKDVFLDLITHSFNKNTEKKYLKYAQYVQMMSMAYFKKLANKDYIYEVVKLANTHNNKIAVTQFMPILREAEIYITNQIVISDIHIAINMYNKALSTRYIEIKNERDLFYTTEKAISNFINVIQNEGLYRPIEKNHLNEDLIQKTLKVALMNEFFKLGLRDIDINREVNLYDDKRTDILIKYGFIGPIMVELKLLHNPEIQNPTVRPTYKVKLQQYIMATYSKYSYYIIFKVKQDKSGDKTQQFNNMKEEYSNINNLKTILIDCIV